MRLVSDPRTGSPTGISWSVDGNVYRRRTPADVGGNRWVFDKPFFLILNLAVGGEWPGYPDASTVFPQRFVIDYVRVSTLDGNPPPAAGSPVSAGWVDPPGGGRSSPGSVNAPRCPAGPTQPD